MDLNISEMVLNGNAKPLQVFLDGLKLLCESRKKSLCLSDLGFELVRLESRSDPADASKVSVSFYPSDALLDFVATRLAGDADLGIVE